MCTILLPLCTVAVSRKGVDSVTTAGRLRLSRRSITFHEVDGTECSIKMTSAGLISTCPIQVLDNDGELNPHTSDASKSFVAAFRPPSSPLPTPSPPPPLPSEWTKSNECHYCKDGEWMPGSTSSKMTFDQCVARQTNTSVMTFKPAGNGNCKASPDCSSTGEYTRYLGQSCDGDVWRRSR